MNNSYFPKTRKDGLMVTKVGDEIVVYDTKTNEASCLDAMTTVVWEACDGNNEPDRILELVQDAGFSESNIASIWNAIDFLDQAEFLEEQVLPGEKKLTKRRELFRMLSIGAIGASPLISTILVKPAMAQMSGPCNPAFLGFCGGGLPPCCPPRLCRNFGFFGFRCL